MGTVGFKTQNTLPSFFQDVHIPSMSLAQTEIASGRVENETNVTFERQKKVDAKRQIENGIQKVANIIEADKKEPEVQQLQSRWAFGSVAKSNEQQEETMEVD